MSLGRWVDAEEILCSDDDMKFLLGAQRTHYLESLCVSHKTLHTITDKQRTLPNLTSLTVCLLTKVRSISELGVFDLVTLRSLQILEPHGNCRVCTDTRIQSCRNGGGRFGFDLEKDCKQLSKLTNLEHLNLRIHRGDDGASMELLQSILSVTVARSVSRCLKTFHYTVTRSWPLECPKFDSEAVSLFISAIPRSLTDLRLPINVDQMVRTVHVHSRA